MISNAIKIAAVFAITLVSTFAYSATGKTVETTEFDIGGVRLGMKFDVALDIAAKTASELDLSESAFKGKEPTSSCTK